MAQRARVVGVLLERTTSELHRFGAAAHGDSRASSAAASHRYDESGWPTGWCPPTWPSPPGSPPGQPTGSFDLAEGLRAHPNLATALAAGRIDRRRAEIALAETATLPDLADRVRVVTMLVGDGTHQADDPAGRDGLIRELRRSKTRLWLLPPATVRRAIRRECAAVDAAQAAAREAIARGNRHVAARSLPDAMGEFRVEAPAHAVAMMYANVDAAARAARAGGDDRTLDQLRADISIGWLTEGALGTFVVRPGAGASTSGGGGVIGGPPARSDPGVWSGAVGTVSGPGVGSGAVGTRSASEPSVGAEDARCRLQLPRPAGALIVVAMADRTALGLSDEPATLFGPDGPVPIPAAVARQIAHDPSLSTWLGLYTDPRTGVATDISPRYRPPPRLRTFVKLRDGLRSRLPVEQREPARARPPGALRPRSTRPRWTDDGGRVESVGLREHHLKTDGALAVTGDANGELAYTTHTGHTYFSWPEPWEDPPLVVDLKERLPRQRRGRDPPSSASPVLTEHLDIRRSPACRGRTSGRVGAATRSRRPGCQGRTGVFAGAGLAADGDGAGSPVRVAVGGVRREHLRHLAGLRGVRLHRDQGPGRERGPGVVAVGRRLAVGALLAVPLGPWVEFRTKRPVMIAMDLVRFVALASIPVAYGLGGLTFAQLVVVSVVVAAARIAFTAASGAYLKALVPAGDLLVANSRFESTTWSAAIFGPTLGGAAIGLLGPVVTVVVDAASYLLSALGITAIGGPDQPPPAREGRPRLADLLEGWRYILRHPTLRPLLLNVAGCQRPDHGHRAAADLPDAGPPRLPGLGVRPGLRGAVHRRAGRLPAGPAAGPSLRQSRVLRRAGLVRAIWSLGLVFVRPGVPGLLIVMVTELALITSCSIFNPVFATYRLERTDPGRLARVHPGLVGHHQREHRRAHRRSGVCWPR